MSLDKIWDFIIDNSIATESELQLVTNINGYNKESLNAIIYAKTGYRSIKQYENS
jgi:hypothetical protein